MTMDLSGLQAILARHQQEIPLPVCRLDNQRWPCDTVVLARQVMALADGLETLRATLDRALPLVLLPWDEAPDEEIERAVSEPEDDRTDAEFAADVEAQDARLTDWQRQERAARIVLKAYRQGGWR